eukprot:476381-Karenia_brevis.AAC.1
MLVSNILIDGLRNHHRWGRTSSSMTSKILMLASKIITDGVRHHHGWVKHLAAGVKNYHAWVEHLDGGVKNHYRWGRKSSWMGPMPFAECHSRTLSFYLNCG